MRLPPHAKLPRGLILLLLLICRNLESRETFSSLSLREWESVFPRRVGGTSPCPVDFTVSFGICHSFLDLFLGCVVLGLSFCSSPASDTPSPPVHFPHLHLHVGSCEMSIIIALPASAGERLPPLALFRWRPSLLHFPFLRLPSLCSQFRETFFAS